MAGVLRSYIKTRQIDILVKISSKKEVGVWKIVMAETEGFEPSVPVRTRTLSRGVVSANSPTSPRLFRGENYAF